MVRLRIEDCEKGECSLPFLPQDVAERLLDWYQLAGRELPWRQTRDPFRIWLSEIMLQQTTVAAVDGYFTKVRLLGQARHTYSHFSFKVDFYRVDLEPCDRVAEGTEHWLPVNDLEQLPLHGAHKKLLPLIGA